MPGASPLHCSPCRKIPPKIVYARAMNHSIQFSKNVIDLNNGIKQNIPQILTSYLDNTYDLDVFTFK